MSTCVSCGHELGVGRFCTNCGHPVGAPPADWRTDTAERQPATPLAPPVGSVPPKPRFPLFADEVDGAPGPVDPAPVPPPPPLAPPPAPSARSPHRRRRSWGPWVAVAAVLVLVAGLGVWLLTDDDGSTATDPGPDRSPSASHSSSTSPRTSAPGDPVPAGDVTAESTAQVPATAPPNQDVQGNPVDFEAANMLDGVPETCWRMAGDGTGEQITITLPGETVVSSVGLVNGYAKTARDAQGRELDWYHGNRRVLSVAWVFDDGTTLDQDLEDSTAMQSIDVDDVRTSTITLRLVSVSAPGTGRAARDYTAISDLSIISAG
ncbi:MULTISPECIES: NADase-type glycan-binding domain-containing protein [unclassified Nocardioides]|uniref:NADase-type glycan-binding domain-containing protein n=1 Tax=unclassified Nocardioides TaxID=2615069 RepID=UPI0009F0EE45|nr:MULTISPECIES: zinc ribbon domain-containing protein [unclassified Nocardioides]GAW51380.1 uncharacterized protein PD653B2_3722 [Nocardioides sp. PD653-B2]GAW54187.1 uncharacterized protein PD653_1595 [Nocardioides sp. PD653]